MPEYRLALVGFGNVGQALVKLLLRKRTLLAEQFDFTFKITGIATGRHGAAINPDGIDPQAALDCIAAGGSLNGLSAAPVPASVLDFIAAVPADFLFENSPVNHLTGQPAVDHVKAALLRGMHAVTANKGTVVHGFDELNALAAAHGRRFMYESTVMDGAPIFSLFRAPLPAAELKGFFGILNSCTNLLLEMMEQGKTLDEAVEYGKSIGITETDPSADIDGWDAAIKVAALATVVMGQPLKPQQVDRSGIRGISAEMIRQARADGERWKLVCRCSRDGGGLRASVKPERVRADSPLYSIGGTSSYVQFELDVLPGLGIVESNPGPDTTAYGLLADCLNALRGM